MTVIIKARNDLGLSQHDLANRIGKHQSFIAKIETRNRQINIVEFVAVANGLGIEPTELLSRVMDALEEPLVF